MPASNAPAARLQAFELVPETIRITNATVQRQLSREQAVVN